MTAWNITKVGRLFTSAQLPTYYPSIIDTSDIPNWPWTVTMFSSADHSSEGSSGIYMSGAVGDPTDPANWETYRAAYLANRFAAWATATGEALPNNGDSRIIIDGLDQCETPCINKIGSYWYITEHDQAGTIGTTNDQPTRMYKSTANGPLNFTKLANGDNGKIINGLTSPGTTWPEGTTQTAHRGYFRWGPNKFADFINPATDEPYGYIGAADCGGKLESPKILMGSDDGETWDHVRQIGSLSGSDQVWGDIVEADATAHYRIAPRYHELDWRSISDAVGGEHWVLTPGRPTTESSAGLHETCFASDGFTETRVRRLVMALGGSGADDESAIMLPTAIEWDGAWLLVYRGRNASNANFLMLATATFDPNAEKAAPLVIPAHDKYEFDARGASALPAWLTQVNGTAVTFDANGMTLPGSANPDGPAIRGPAFDTATASWAEIYIEEPAGNAAPSASFNIYMGFWDAASGTTSTQAIRAQVDNSNRQVDIVHRTGSANTTISDAAWPWKDTIGTTPSQATRKNRHGLRWYITEEKIAWLTGGRNRAGNEKCNLDISARTDITGTMYPFIFGLNLAEKIEQMSVRIGNASGNTIPVISSAAATSATEIVFTFDREVIGNGTGFVVKEGGSAVTGTFSRPSTTTLKFTRSSGTWGDAALTYDISDSDIRS